MASSCYGWKIPTRRASPIYSPHLTSRRRTTSADAPRRLALLKTPRAACMMIYGGQGWSGTKVCVRSGSETAPKAQRSSRAGPRRSFWALQAGCRLYRLNFVRSEVLANPSFTIAVGPVEPVSPACPPITGARPGLSMFLLPASPGDAPKYPRRCRQHFCWAVSGHVSEPFR